MLKMKFLLPILILGSFHPDAQDTLQRFSQEVPDAKDAYVRLINFHEREDYKFVKPISDNVDSAVTYEEIREQAILNCKNVKDISKIKEQVIDDLIEIEKSFNVPDEMRGMLLAAACSESGYNPKARGDHKFSKSKKKPMAIGILQMWPWWESTKHGFGIDRTDHKAAARAWMTHVTSKLSKVKRQCRYKTPERQWVAAWVTAIRKPKATGRCNEKPLHLAILKKWHRLVKVERNFVPGC